MRNHARWHGSKYSQTEASTLTSVGMDASVYSYPMNRIFLFLLLALGTMQLSAQTIIELKHGGTVRAKTADEYRQENGTAEKMRADSLQYVDHIRRAFSALHADSLTEAEDLLQAAIKLRPDAPGNQVLRYNLALIRVARGQMADAVKLLDAVLKDNPDHFESRITRAEANLQLNKAQEALRDANALLPVDNRYAQIPTDIQERAQFVKAAAHYQMRLYVEARADLTQILKNNPQNLNARILEALCLHHSGQPKEALNRLNFIVAAQPDLPDALSTRAQVESDLEMYAPAKADYDRLIELQPDQTEWLVERARTLLRMGEKAAARKDLDKAVQMGLPMGMVQALYNLTR